MNIYQIIQRGLLTFATENRISPQISVHHPEIAKAIYKPGVPASYGACALSWKNRVYDLSADNTVESADDLEDIRKALQA